MSEETGQKHTKNCIDCGVVLEFKKNWSYSFKKKAKYFCVDCDVKRNAKRMYVNGKYISNLHPLYTPGRYKGFTDAAFSSLQNYEDSKQGQVYVIRNPAFPSWCKVGMAVDAEDRLNSYQTSSPHRDYVLIHKEFFYDRRRAEAQAHIEAGKLAEEHNSEWFKLDNYTATLILKGLDKSVPNEVERLTGAFKATQ